MTEPWLYQLTEVKKEYLNRIVLSIKFMEILRGEILAIVGPSGSGKSTLLRLLNFLEPPSSGTIAYDGSTFTVDQSPPLNLRRQITTVFQRPILLDRTVEENVAYGLKLRNQRDTRHVVEAALQQVSLAHLCHQRARLLSGGEAQRVALARALVLRPSVLLLDEPTANLDPYNISLIEKIVRQANQELGTTIIIVTHNVFQARRLAHRVALLLGGQLIEIAEASKFFDHPTDDRTRLFVQGEMIY